MAELYETSIHYEIATEALAHKNLLPEDEQDLVKPINS